jgi:hypothetical protein
MQKGLTGPNNQQVNQLAQTAPNKQLPGGDLQGKNPLDKKIMGPTERSNQ